MMRIPHFVRYDGARGDLRDSRRNHRRVVVNKCPGEWIGLPPSGIDSLARLNPIPRCGRCLYASQRHDRAIP